MTSNQLQAQKNAIEQQMADEQERHNLAVEEETNRANVAHESLTEEANAINQQIADETERHNKATEDLTREYNAVYLELQRAQGDRRLELESKANEIKQQLADEDVRHNKEMEGLEEEANRIKDALADEDARHNKEMEGLKRTDQTLTENAQRIQEELNKYQNAYWTGILESNKAQRLLELNKLNTNYELENARIQVLSGNLELDTRKWNEAERKRVESETLRNRFNAFTSLLPSAQDIGGIAKGLMLLVP